MFELRPSGWEAGLLLTYIELRFRECVDENVVTGLKQSKSKQSTTQQCKTQHTTKSGQSNMATQTLSSIPAGTVVI